MGKTCYIKPLSEKISEKNADLSTAKKESDPGSEMKSDFHLSF